MQRAKPKAAKYLLALCLILVIAVEFIRKNMVISTPIIEQSQDVAFSEVPSALSHALLIPDAIKTKFKELMEYQRGFGRYEAAANRKGGATRYSYEEFLFDNNMQTYREVYPYLPKSPEKIVDIGCGFALYDSLIYHHYRLQGKEVNFYLVDQTRVEKPSRFGYEDNNYKFYSSLEWAVKIAILNGVSPNSIHPVEASPENVTRIGSETVDFVHSHVSWGFHYPISLYLEAVYHILKPGGILYVQIRRHKGAERVKLLKKRFRKCVERTGFDPKHRILPVICVK